MRVACRMEGKDWKGQVESWGDVKHLQGMWEKDIGAADDLL